MIEESVSPKKSSLLERVGWMVIIWVSSVAALGTVAYGMRLLMKIIGLSVSGS